VAGDTLIAGVLEWRWGLSGPARLIWMFGAALGRASLAGSAVLLMSGVAATQAQPAPEHYNTVELQAEAQREAGNDTLYAMLFVELNEVDAAKLAAALNQAANDALALAKEFKLVRVRSGNNQTFPVYDRQQRLTGWRGRAELRLEGRDFAAASALIARLQASLQLGQIGFSISPEMRKGIEDELIAEAIQAFRARADIARVALGGRGYKIRRIAVHTGGGLAPPRPMLARSAAASEALPAPQFEGGTSQITVSVSGAIEVE
jgi:predicted secreted protein